jgi:tol-pal system protein YbgF
MRRLVLATCLALLGAPAFAQDRAQSLADIRAELSALMAEFNALKAELVSTGAVSTGAAGGDALQRMDAIEAELQRLTSRTEEVELKLNRVVQDGTNRIGDLEFRVCELTEGCDIASLSKTEPLGGVTTGTPAPVDPAAGGTTPVTGEMAVGEQAEFDRAREVLAQGDFQGAATLFATYAQTYPGGALTADAHFLRGEALGQLGQTADAARAYLDAFNAAPDGPKAGDALLRLGEGLGALGQTPEACVTLGEVGVRFPGSLAATQAQVAMQGLGCQ